mgnify:CR=1 FL=1|uniref:Uncharacterized protein n=2 Tax=Thermorudis TaxID=1649508 RepID=A0A831X0J7_9BACT
MSPSDEMIAIKSQGTSTARQAVGTQLRATLGINAVALLALTACGTTPPLPVVIAMLLLAWLCQHA